MNSDRSAQLETGSIPGLLLKFAAPAIVGTMTQAMYMIIDRVFVGRAIGANGIAGITVSFPFMLIVLAFSMLIGFGGTTLISLRLGEKNKAEAERILGISAILLVFASLVITFLGLAFVDQILTFFGASREVLPFAHDYLVVIILGSGFHMIGFGLNAAIRGEGNPRIAMLSILISVLLNAILAPIFIFKLSWGMKGAALATIIGQAVSAVWVVSYFLFGTSLLKLRPSNMRLDLGICRNIFANGSPAFAMQLVGSVLQSILNHQLGVYGGDLAIASMGIIFSVAMLFAMPVLGLNQGAQPIIGYNYGAQRFDRVKKALETAILAGTTATALGFVIVMLFPVQVIRFFDSKNADQIALGSHAIRIAMCMTPLIGFQIVSSHYFQAVGKPTYAMLLMLSRQVFFLVPALLVLPLFFGLDGVWASLPAADFASSVLTAFYLFFELRRLKDRHLATEPT
jgi:putative MATE family efflux protein